MMRNIFLGISAVVVVAFALPTEVFARSLSVGLSGSDVTALQQVLISKGYLSASATGYFGPQTLAAVKKFQCEQGIVCSGSSYGLAGPQTQAALGISASSGSSSSVPAGTQNPGNLTGVSLGPKWTGPLEFSGWVPDWRAASGTQDVLPHLNQLKSVMPFGYTMSASGHVIDSAKINQAPWPAFIAAAKAQGVRVVPTIMWGNGDEIHAVLSNTTKRIALEDEIAALVKANNFDGIDIDFEAKQHETIDYFSTFLKGLYQRMGSKWVYCTIEARMPLNDRYLPGQTIPPDATDYANDYNAMNKYCDRVEIMAYDQGIVDKRLNIARSAPYAPVADPGWVENIVNLAAQSIDKKKLIIGVPTYGYEYLVTPQAGGGFKYQVQWAFNPNYALNIASQLGITPHRTSAGELGFTYNPSALQALAPSNGDSTQLQQQAPQTDVTQNLGSQVDTSQPFNYMTWSDAQAVKDKVDLAKRLGVRGVAVFSLGGAQGPDMWNILK